MGTLIINQYLNFDVDATAYIAAVESADGQVLESTTRMAFDRFIKGCKNDGIWDAISSSCILAGARTLDGALTPLKGPSPTNYNFVSEDYNRKTGLKGNATDKYLSSNRSQNSESNTSVHLSAYNTVERLGGDETLIGVQSYLALNNIRVRFGREDISFHCNSPTEITVPYAVGFQGATRGDSDNITVRSAGTNTTTASPAGSMQNVFYNIFATSLGSGASNFSSEHIAFYSIGSDIDLALLDSRVSQLMTDINNAF